MGLRQLLLVLIAAVAFGLLFGIYPELDLRFSSLFFDPVHHTFVHAGDSLWAFWRSANIWLFTGVLTVLCIYFAVNALRGRSAVKRVAATRAFLLLALSAIIGPGLIVNGLLKEQWGRPRPGEIVEFNTHAQNHFTPWWDADGPCENNCSFVAGEASIAFWLLAPATLIASRRRRRLAYAAVIAIGSLAGLLRIAVGGHFLSDVVFAGVVIFTVVWFTHRLVYHAIRPDLLSSPLAEGEGAPQAAPVRISG